MKDPQILDASIIKALRAKGYKATPQRIAISRLTLSSQDHPTAQRIYSEVKKVYPTVSLATVYKTIQILKEAGLIQQLNSPQGQKRGLTRFDSDTNPHLNLVCLRCGSIKDWEDPSVPEIIAKVAAITNFTATGQSLDVYGICQSCDRKAKSTALRAAVQV
jgi:Fur family transcriptional regulator, peroxide stress response regulator